MSDNYMTNVIMRTKVQINQMLDSALAEYERHLGIRNDLEIAEQMVNLTERFKKDKTWVGQLFGETFQYDMYIAGATAFLSLISSKIINLEKSQYMRINKAQLLNMFRAMQRINHVATIDDQSILLLAKHADKFLEQDTIEYRTIRLLCISKIINLYNITNVFANLIVTQDEIVEAQKIRITADIGE